MITVHLTFLLSLPGLNNRILSMSAFHFKDSVFTKKTLIKKKICKTPCATQPGSLVKEYLHNMSAIQFTLNIFGNVVKNSLKNIKNW